MNFTVINFKKKKYNNTTNSGSRVGTVMRALAFHQCVPGSIPGLGVISR